MENGEPRLLMNEARVATQPAVFVLRSQRK